MRHTLGRLLLQAQRGSLSKIRAGSVGARGNPHKPAAQILRHIFVVANKGVGGMPVATSRSQQQSVEVMDSCAWSFGFVSHSGCRSLDR